MSGEFAIRSNKGNIWIQIIIGVVAIIIALIPFLFHKSNGLSNKELVFSGTVVSEETNEQVSDALLTVVGRNESEYSQSNGNFSIVVKDSTLTEIRVRVTKKGFVPEEKKYDLPSTSVIIVLKKETK